MSWIHVGSDENRINRMVEFGNHFFNHHHFNESENPYREWMSINFPRQLLGCHFCPAFVCGDPDEFGTKKGSNGSISKFVSCEISNWYIWVRYKSAQAISNDPKRFPRHESALVHLLAKLSDSDSKVVNLKEFRMLDSYTFLHFLSILIVFNFFNRKFIISYLLVPLDKIFLPLCWVLFVENRSSSHSKTERSSRLDNIEKFNGTYPTVNMKSFIRVEMLFITWRRVYLLNSLLRIFISCVVKNRIYLRALVNRGWQNVTQLLIMLFVIRKCEYWPTQIIWVNFILSFFMKCE